MLAMLGAFVVGGLVVFPINLLIATSIVVFGPSSARVIALAGSLASATVLHQIGSAVSRARLDALRGPPCRDSFASASRGTA